MELRRIANEKKHQINEEKQKKKSKLNLNTKSIHNKLERNNQIFLNNKQMKENLFEMMLDHSKIFIQEGIKHILYHVFK